MSPSYDNGAFSLCGGVGEKPLTKSFPVPVHVDTAPDPDNVHVTRASVLVKRRKLTVPVGVVAPLADVSVTVAVQDTIWSVTTVVGVHTSTKLVGCRFATVICTVAELVA